MALPSFEYQQTLLVQQFANALYDAQVGSTTLESVLADIDAAGADAVFNSYYSFSYGSESYADVAAMVTANVNIIEGENGVTAEMVTLTEAYIVSVLNANVGNEGAALSSLLTSYAAVATGPYADAVASWNAEIATAMDYTGEDDVAPGTENPVDTMFMLTANQDIIDGSAGDDMFVADVVQVNGPQANSLGTGDYINGDAGYDTLAAIVTEGVFLGGGNMPIQPWLDSVEAVELQAVNSNIGLEFDSLNLNQVLDLANDLLPTNVSLETDVYVNAKNMTGLDMISSVNSDANLIIQDLKTDVNEENPSGFDHTVTQTVGMKYSANADSRWAESDLHVYFDQDHLSAGIEAQPSQAYFWLLDEDGHDATIADAPPGYDAGDEEYGGYEPLQSIDREGVRFSLTDVDGNNTQGLEVKIGTNTSLDYRDATDWHTYVDFLNQELAAEPDPIYSTLSFSIDPELIDTTNSDLNLDVEIPAMVLTDSANGTFPKEDLGFVRDSGATGEFDVYGRVDNEIVGPEDLLITVNVELEKVGRGGDGGELVIGGMNKVGDNVWGHGSDTTPAGVEQFDVVVNGDHFLPNSLSSLRSTNNALQVVNVTSQEGIESSVVLDEDGEDTGLREGAASLEIGNSNTATWLHEAPHKGLDVGYIDDYDNALKDVRVFDASTFQGDLTINAGLTSESEDKYELEDVSDIEDVDPVSFDYTGGVGNDTIRLQIWDSYDDGDSFVTNIDGGDGHDVILTRGGDSMITGGLGDDVFHLSGDSDSNETLVYEGYAVAEYLNGTDTVYNFDQTWNPGGLNLSLLNAEVFILDFADFTGNTTSFTH